jgi:hypothetical protein
MYFVVVVRVLNDCKITRKDLEKVTLEDFFPMYSFLFHEKINTS